MRRAGFRAVMVPLLALLTAGCTYVVDRSKDLVDCLGFEFYSGHGGLVNVRATKLAQAGLGGFDGASARLSHRAVGCAEEMRAEFGAGPGYYTAYDRKVLHGNDKYREIYGDPTRYGEGHWNPRDKHDRNFYEIGASAALFIGIGVHTDIVQIFDFALGFFFIDIGNDDARNAETPATDNPRYEGIRDKPLSAPEPEDV